MLRLRTFGGLAVERDQAPVGGAGGQRRPLALLAQLAVAGSRGLSRAKLVSLLWPDADEERARRTLAQTLYSLRRDLGADDLFVGTTELQLNPERIGSDVADFVAAADRGELSAAAAAYGGPFLDGFYLSSAPDFERWVEETRSAFATRYVQIAERLAEAARDAGDCRAEGHWRRKLAAVDPLNARHALALMRALAAAGGRAGALQHARIYEALLREELDLPPDPEVTALADRIRRETESPAPAALGPSAPAAGGPPHIEIRAADASERHPSAAPSAESTAPPPPSASPAPVEALRTTASHRISAGMHRLLMTTTEMRLAASVVAAHRAWQRGKVRWIAAAAAAALIAAVSIPLALHFRSGQAATDTGSVELAGTARGRPLVALTGVRTSLPDTALAWLAQGLPEMVAAALLRSGEVDVAPPAQLRDVLRRAQASEGEQSLSVLRDAGMRVGATIVASGDLTRDDGSLVLHLSIYDVATGKLLQLSEISAVSPLALVDAAAASLFEVAGQSNPGPMVADVGTTSIDAYRLLLRAMQARDGGDWRAARLALDSAIALDSGFIAAIQMRLDGAITYGDAQGRIPALRALFARNAARATEWDRTYQAAQTAFDDGDNARAEHLGEDLVRRWPRDPRGLALLHRIYSSHGRLAEAERISRLTLALDSLGIEAGRGPCAPCGGYGGLAQDRLTRSDDAGAIAAARRWTALQPENPAAWSTLAQVLRTVGQLDGALAAWRRGEVASGGGSVFWVERVRTLIMARRLDEAEREIARALDASRGPDSASAAHRYQALDMRSLLERERGQLRASNRTIAELERFGDTGGLDLVRAYNLGLLGDPAAAERGLEEIAHRGGAPMRLPIVGADARAFSWRHALLADALRSTADTARLDALGDSIEVVASRSYYGRDWRLPHHVRGLVAARAGRWADAARELGAAEWPLSRWPRTSIELARAELALGQPAKAIATLRAGYRGPLDAMARYASRSELDLWMSRAFLAAGMRDSAGVYERYVQAAWKGADPEFLRALGSRLSALGEGTLGPATRTEGFARISRISGSPRIAP